MENNDCHPICDSPCINSECIEPNKCKCLPGFMKSEISDFCTLCHCPNGFCSDGECQCNSGFIKSANDICKPECPKDCLSGHCAFPNICDFVEIDTPKDSEFESTTSEDDSHRFSPEDGGAGETKSGGFSKDLKLVSIAATIATSITISLICVFFCCKYWIFKSRTFEYGISKNFMTDNGMINTQITDLDDNSDIIEYENSLYTLSEQLF